MAGRPSSKTEREARGQRIRAADARGDRAEQIARREGVSARQVRRVLAASDPAPPAVPAVLDAPDVFTIDPFRELANCVAAHKEAVTVLRAVSQRSTNDAVVVGASRSAAAASAALIDLLGRVGVLPSRPFEWKTEDQWRSVWRVLGQALTECGVDAPAFAEQLRQRVARSGVEIELTGLGPEFFEAVAA